MAANPLPPIPSAPVAPVDLRPLTTSELIDRGFALYRSHFAGFLLLALLCQTAPLSGDVFVTAFKLKASLADVLSNHPAVTVRNTVAPLIVWFFVMLIVYCFEVVITFYVSDAYLGKIPSVTNSLRRWTTCIASSLWTCVLSRLLMVLTLIFPFLAVTASSFYYAFFPPMNLISLVLFWGFSFLLFFASLVPVLVVFMRLWETVPAVALEGLSGWQAVKRSSTLVRYDPGLGILYWGEMRLSFLLLPLFIIEMLILSLTSLPLTVVQFSDAVRRGSQPMGAPPDSTLILSTILTFLAVSVILPLYAIATTLFYYDVRIRREGFDLEFMAENLKGKT
jgi:hypothetical protein